MNDIDLFGDLKNEDIHHNEMLIAPRKQALERSDCICYHCYLCTDYFCAKFNT
jgi:hypothetical protein